MTNEEAAVWFEKILAGAKQGLEEHPEEGKRVYGMRKELAEIALTALRPVSREQVEKVWAGCEYCEKHKINLVRIEMNYNDSPGSPERLNPTRVPKFCPICGRPLTDEAVQMVIERMEAMKDAETD